MRGCQHIGEPARIAPAARRKARQHGLHAVHLPLRQPPAEHGISQPREDDSPVDPHDEILDVGESGTTPRLCGGSAGEKKFRIKTIEEISIV
jgi:hypothetical protein